jgi:hypothetical protein
MKGLYEELGRRGKVLIIFDNATSYISDANNFGIREYLPTNLAPNLRKPYVLITSRHSSWVPGIKVMELNVLPETEALNLVRAELSGITFNEDAAKKMCTTLGCLPLALQQAVAYIRVMNEVPIKDFNCPIEKYLELFDHNFDTLFEECSDAFETSVLVTWNVTLEKIKGGVGGSVALELMQVIAGYWKPDNINLKYFLLIFSEEELNIGIRLLKQYSMISESKGIVSVHRLVKKVVWSQLDVQTKRNLGPKISLVHYKERYSHYLETQGPESSSTLIYRGYLVNTLNRLGRYQEAIQECKEQLAALKTAVDNGSKKHIRLNFEFQLGVARTRIYDYQGTTRLICIIISY